MKLILCLLCLLMFAPVVAEAQGTKNKRQPSVEEQLNSLVRQWDEAIVKRDTATLDRLLATEFAFVGGLKKAAYLESVKSQAPDAVTSAVSTDLEVLVNGGMAVGYRTGYNFQAEQRAALYREMDVYRRVGEARRSLAVRPHARESVQ